MFLLSSTRLDRSNFIALYYRIFLKIKLTFEVIDDDIDHFWLLSFVYPFIIVHDEVCILFTTFDVLLVSCLYKRDIEEYIIGHSGLSHIRAGLSMSPITDHTTSHPIYRRKFYKNAHICEFSKSRMTESEKPIKNDKVFWFDDFSGLSLRLTSWVISKVIAWYLNFFTIFELFYMSYEEVSLQSLWRIKIFKCISFKLDIEAFGKTVMRVIIHIHRDSIDTICSKHFNDFLCEISFSRTASADEIYEVHIL